MKDYKGGVVNFKLCEIGITYTPKKFKVSELPKATQSSDCDAYLRCVYPSLNHCEYFYIMCMNNDNRILGCSQISKGGMTGTVIDVRIILQTALKSNATCIILSHNHPSGNLIPSSHDKDMTRKIKEAGTQLDIKVLDHIILTPDSYFSFADEGLI